MSIRPSRAHDPSCHSEIRELAPRTCTQVRSTVVVSSMQALHASGYGERYMARLPEGARERLLSIGAPTWLPLELAWTHYATCNALGLAQDEIAALGARVAPVHASGAALVLRAARSSGLTPWAILEQADRFWRRMYEGGRLETYRDGPKDARLVVRGQPLARLRYWRTGLLGVIRNLTAQLTSQLYVRDELTRDEDGGPPVATYHLAWV